MIHYDVHLLKVRSGEARRESPARPGNQGETATHRILIKDLEMFWLETLILQLVGPLWLMILRKERCWKWFCKGTCSILFTIEHKCETAEQLVVSLFFSACSSNHFVDHLDRNGKPDDEWSSEWMIKFMVTNLWQNTPSFHKLKSCWQHDAHAMCSACSARDVAPKPACGIAWYREINHWHCMFVEGLLDILWQIWSAFMSKMILIFWIGKYFFVPFSQFWLFIIKGAFLKPHACWTKFVLPIWNHMLRR